MNMLTWWGTAGAASRVMPDRNVYSTPLVAKPAFSFAYSALRYSDRGNDYFVDGKPMTAAQQAEVRAAIQSIQPPVEWLKSMKLSEIMKAYEQDVAAILQRQADPFEMASWRKQEEEARAYLSSVQAATPMIDGLRMAREKDETREVLSQKIIARADAFTSAYAAILGRKQARIDALAAALSDADVETIVW